MLELEDSPEVLPFISYQCVGQVMLRDGEEDLSHTVDDAVVSPQINHLHLLTVDGDESLHTEVIINHTRRTGGELTS